jgi:hypothetical protein
MPLLFLVIESQDAVAGVEGGHRPRGLTAPRRSALNTMAPPQAKFHGSAIFSSSVHLPSARTNFRLRLSFLFIIDQLSVDSHVRKPLAQILDYVG